MSGIKGGMVLVLLPLCDSQVTERGSCVPKTPYFAPGVAQTNCVFWWGKVSSWSMELV